MSATAEHRRPHYQGICVRSVCVYSASPTAENLLASLDKSDNHLCLNNGGLYYTPSVHTDRNTHRVWGETLVSGQYYVFYTRTLTAEIYRYDNLDPYARWLKNGTREEQISIHLSASSSRLLFIGFCGKLCSAWKLKGETTFEVLLQFKRPVRCEIFKGSRYGAREDVMSKLAGANSVRPISKRPPPDVVWR
ncbi:hypothetical protein AVEN_259108-1 [Araneus ventricosus]|uniref:Uncharacterized protein n=1 Tax=Araneus ventricosus TaxID=182803 RepID=A0A4Y2QU14_ARAVE|nr:hypothetical protein AVEN_259108-1 [Araneus ventricosus]